MGHSYPEIIASIKLTSSRVLLETTEIPISQTIDTALSELGIGVIVGIALGGLAVILLLVGLIVCCVRMSKKKDAQNEINTKMNGIPTGPPNGPYGGKLPPPTSWNPAEDAKLEEPAPPNYGNIPVATIAGSENTATMMLPTATTQIVTGTPIIQNGYVSTVTSPAMVQPVVQATPVIMSTMNQPAVVQPVANMNAPSYPSNIVMNAVSMSPQAHQPVQPIYPTLPQPDAGNGNGNQRVVLNGPAQPAPAPMPLGTALYSDPMQPRVELLNTGLQPGQQNLIVPETAQLYYFQQSNFGQPTVPGGLISPPQASMTLNANAFTAATLPSQAARPTGGVVANQLTQDGFTVYPASTVAYSTLPAAPSARWQ